MDVLYIDVEGIFNSFREPNAQRYQKTLLLPPPTTIAGFFCAAAGWGKTDDLLRQAGVSVILLRQIGGYGKDLWKYHKRKTGKESPTPDVLFREFQYGNCYRLFLFSDGKLIKDFAKALETPLFALTLGSSEEIVNIKGKTNIKEGIKPVPLQKFNNTILPGDHRGSYKPNIDMAKLKEILYNLTPPDFIHIPVLFEYDSEKGRIPKRVEPLTLSVGFELELKNPISGYEIDGFSVVPCGPYNE